MADKHTETTHLYFHPELPAAEAWNADPAGAEIRRDISTVREERSEVVLYERDGDRWQPLLDGGVDLDALRRGLVCRVWKTGLRGQLAWGVACVRPLDTQLLEGLHPRDEEGFALQGTPSLFVLLDAEARVFLGRFKAAGGKPIQITDTLPEAVRRAQETILGLLEAIRALREQDRVDLERARGGDLSVGASFDRRTGLLRDQLRQLDAAACDLRSATGPHLTQERTKDERNAAREARAKLDEQLRWAQLEYEQRSSERLQLDALEAAAEGRRPAKRSQPETQLDVEIAQLALTRLLEEGHGPVELMLGDQVVRVVDGRISLN